MQHVQPINSDWKYMDMAEHGESLEPNDRWEQPKDGGINYQNTLGFAYSTAYHNV